MATQLPDDNASGQNIPLDDLSFSNTADQVPLGPAMPADLPEDVIQSQSDLAQAATGGQVPVAQPPTAPQPPPISGPKEQRELGPISPEPDKFPTIEQKEPEPDAEVKDWMHKLEEGETVQLPQPITDDFGQVLVEASTQTKPKIILPLDEEEFKKGLHQKVISSMRWLAEWCLRVMKLAAGRVFYKKAD